MQPLENPPETRSGGFNFKTTYAEPRIIEGNRRRAIQPSVQLIELWRDGNLIAIGRGDEDFLCWNAARGNTLVVNAIALIESVYDFVELSRRAYLLAEPQPADVEYVIFLRNMTREGPSHVGGPSYIRGRLRPVGTAPGPALERKIRANIQTEHVGQIAYKIVAAVYEWYGIDHDQILLRECSPETKELLESIDLSRINEL